jgi:hypothetical protein
MDGKDKHLNQLRLAEQQFRLACTVHLAVTNDVQTLDVPVDSGSLKDAHRGRLMQTGFHSPLG